MQNLILDWDGPFTFTTLISSKEIRRDFNNPGVYLWVDHQRQPEQICYVGKSASSLWGRQFEHYVSLIGGQYKIPNLGSNTSYAWEIKDNCQEVIDTLLDESKFCDVVKAGFAYAKHIDIYLCRQAAREVKTLEKMLLYYLKPLDTRFSLSRPEPMIQLRHGNIKWATEAVRKQIRPDALVTAAPSKYI